MKRLNIHYFQHVSFEGLGGIEEWITQKKHNLSSTRFYEDGVLPVLADIDWLIIMGGPMSVNDEKKYPWLTSEIQFIKNAILSGKTVIGICLGSQLIAKALGARVYKNLKKEIGWFNIRLTPEAKNTKHFLDFKKEEKVFHWHGDTFDIPNDAILMASSEVCMNQAFILNNKVLALQFHLETTKESLEEMIKNGRDELVESEYIQTDETQLINEDLINHNNELLFSLLSSMAD